MREAAAESTAGQLTTSGAPPCAADVADEVQRTVTAMLARPVRLEPLVAANGRARTYRCIDQHGRRLIAKVLFAGDREEHRPMRFLAERGGLIVPRVIGVRDCPAAGGSVILMTELPGPMLVEHLRAVDDSTRARWGSAAGQLLRRLHAIRFERCGWVDEHGVHPGARGDMRALLESIIRDARGKCARIGCGDTSFGMPMGNLLREVDHAAALLASLPTRTPRLVHGDFTPMNLILIDGGETHPARLGLIDFEWMKSFDDAFDAAHYLLATHHFEAHWRAFWRTWTDGDQARCDAVAAYVFVVILARCGWTIAHQRRHDAQSQRFLGRFSNLVEVRRWLRDSLS